MANQGDAGNAVAQTTATTAASNNQPDVSSAMNDPTSDFDPETMEMLMANLPQNIFRAPDPRLQRAWQETERTDQITPILKEELRLRILSKRLEKGEPELDPDPATPKVYELTEEEKRKRERRKEQNRRAAKKCRERRKLKNLSLAEHMEMVRESNQTLNRDVARLVRHKDLLEKFCIEHIWSGRCPHVAPDPVSRQKVEDYFNAEAQESPKSTAASTQTPYSLDEPTTSAGSFGDFGQVVNDDLESHNMSAIIQEQLPSSSVTPFNVQTSHHVITTAPADPTLAYIHTRVPSLDTMAASRNASASATSSTSTSSSSECRPNFLFSADADPLVPSGFELASSQGSDQSASPLLSPNSLFQLSEMVPPVFTIHMDEALSCVDQHIDQPMLEQGTSHDHCCHSQVTEQDANAILQAGNLYVTSSSRLDLGDTDGKGFSGGLGVANNGTVQTVLLHSPVVPNACVQMSPLTGISATSLTMLNPISPISPQSPSSPNLSLSPSSPSVLLATEGIHLQHHNPYLQQPTTSLNAISQLQMNQASHVITRSVTPKMMTSVPILQRSSSTISTPSPYGCSTTQLSPPPSVSSSPPFTPVPESPIFVSVSGGDDLGSNPEYHITKIPLHHHLESPASSNCSDSYSPFADFINGEHHNM